MAEKGSFWSSLPGVLTGIAGLLTAVVALVSLGASQGWIGGGGGGGGPAGGGDAEAPPVLDVEPRAVEFEPVPGTSREATVTVTNDGSAPFRVDEPELTGPDADRFDVDAGGCTGGPIPAGRSCELLVTFDPDGPGRASATLVVSVNDAARSVEVPVQGAAVLG